MPGPGLRGSRWASGAPGCGNARGFPVWLRVHPAPCPGPRGLRASKEGPRRVWRASCAGTGAALIGRAGQGRGSGPGHPVGHPARVPGLATLASQDTEGRGGGAGGTVGRVRSGRVWGPSWVRGRASGGPASCSLEGAGVGQKLLFQALEQLLLLLRVELQGCAEGAGRRGAQLWAGAGARGRPQGCGAVGTGSLGAAPARAPPPPCHPRVLPISVSPHQQHVLLAALAAGPPAGVGGRQSGSPAFRGPPGSPPIQLVSGLAAGGWGLPRGDWGA